MAQLSLEKAAHSYNSIKTSVKGNKEKVVVVLRLVSLFATLAATLVMALNKETKTIVVATIGTTSIKVSLTAKFQDTPANIFFVVANGLATVHNMLVLAVDVFGKKLERRGARFVLISILDTINLAILSAGATSAAFMAELAQHGNSHAAWNKVCDKFETFCDHGAGALLASFIGLAFLLLVTLISNYRLYRTASIENNSSVEI